MADGAEDGLVLGGPGHDRAGRSEAPAGTEDRQVDGFGSGGREDDLDGIDTERAGRHVARLVERRQGRPPLAVRTGGVAGRDVRQCLGDLGQDTGAGGVVEVDATGLLSDFGWGP